MPFEFLSAGRIVFGSGALGALGPAARVLGRRALLVTGRNPERSAPFEEALRAAGIEFAVFRAGGEPDTDTLESVRALGRSEGVEFVVAAGGGSALDLGKAAAATIPSENSLFDHLEVVGRGLPLARPALPTIALPTTSGTGAEVTKNAVLTARAARVKVSLRHDSMLPRLALVDPDFTRTVPPDVTAATGLDALTQCIEPFLSHAAQPFTDALAREGMTRGARSLRRAVSDGNDAEARFDMSFCSVAGGLALANAKLGAVHGFAGPLGGLFDAPHGALCARLLPVVCDVNLRALRARAPHHPSLARFDELARLFTGRSDARAEEGILWLEALVEELRVPRLARYGLEKRHVAELVLRGKNASSMKGNPLPLEDDELSEILERST